MVLIRAGTFALKETLVYIQHFCERAPIGVLMSFLDVIFLDIYVAEIVPRSSRPLWVFLWSVASLMVGCLYIN